MNDLEELTRVKDEDEDTKGDGPEAPVVAPVTEEIEDSYAMAEDWLQGYRDLKAKQALSASLKEKWADGPITYLGLSVNGFPNLFTITGPGSPSVLSNMMTSIEQHVDWISNFIEYSFDKGITEIEASNTAEIEWTSHVEELAENSLKSNSGCNSWYLGSNVPGKKRVFMPYIGGVGKYREECDDIASTGYRGFVLN